MRFRTEISILKSKYKIDHNYKILSLGSCFAQEIGNKLSSSLFQIKINPFGISYNNMSINKLIQYCMDEKRFLVDDLGYNEHSKLYFHYDFHSSLSNSDPKVVIDNLNSTIRETRNYLKDLDLLILTMGTSYVYQTKNQIVSNCHKMPAVDFDKKLISIDAQINCLASTIESLTFVSPKVKLLLTVSPIRHIKEGLTNNAMSKAMLRVVCDMVTKKFSNAFYFPSYEIMMDDLRDYRFYKSDLIHPSDMAINYIWEYFEDTFFDKTTLEINSEIQKFNRLRGHQVMEKNKSEFESHNSKIKAIKHGLAQKYPFLVGRF